MDSKGCEVIWVHGRGTTSPNKNPDPPHIRLASWKAHSTGKPITQRAPVHVPKRVVAPTSDLERMLRLATTQAWYTKTPGKLASQLHQRLANVDACCFVMAVTLRSLLVVVAVAVAVVVVVPLS